MAENILGLLFVTSTSKGRNVFRYPPDPTSPHTRLSQPIYPASTYTAQDTTIDLQSNRNKLFPHSGSAGGSGRHRHSHHTGSEAGVHNRHGSLSQFRDSDRDGGRGSIGGGTSGLTRISSSKAISVEASSRPSRLRGLPADRLDDGDGDDVMGVKTSGRPTPTISGSLARSHSQEDSDSGSRSGTSSDSDESSSDDAEYNGLWESSVLAARSGRIGGEGPSGALLTGNGISTGARRGSTETEILKESTPKMTESALFEHAGGGGGRRGSLADSERTSRPERVEGSSRKTESTSKPRRDREKERDRREATNTGDDSGKGDDNQHDHDTFIEDQYTHALGYSLDFLSDLLTPPRAACNRKFEVCVDELVFVGHPVCIGKDGRWAWPNEEDDEDGDDRGRRAGPRGRRARDRTGSGAGTSGLRTVVEYKESLFRRAGCEDDDEDEDEEEEQEDERGPDGSFNQNRSRAQTTRIHRSSNSSNGSNNNDNPTTQQQTFHQQTQSLSSSQSLSQSVIRKTDDDPPILNTFHLVLVFDKPDPQTDTPILDGPGTVGMYDEAYREICFKWTAAAFALQVRDNWVGRESELVARHRERGISLGNPVIENLRQAIELYPLARSLNNLYNEIHGIKNKTINSHFSTLATTLTINVADIPITLVLSPKASAISAASAYGSAWRRDELGMHGGGWSGDSDNDDDDDEYDDVEWGRWNERLVARPDVALLAKQSGLRVEPWQTLLLLHNESQVNPVEAKAVGGGYRTPTGTSRRGSKATVEDDDERVLFEALINACDVSKPLAEIAHTLRYDLDGIVIPLARDLVQSQRAILIDVINIRLRTIVTPTTIVDHRLGIDDCSLRFQSAFPNLPPLIALLSSISSGYIPFRDLLPPEAEQDFALRDLYLRSLIWLLQNDLVRQVHTRARIFARPEVKKEAWVKLWYRRREKWLKRRRSITSSGIGIGGTGTGGHSFSHGHPLALSGGGGGGGIGSPFMSSTGSPMVTPRANEVMLKNPLDSISPGQGSLTAQETSISSQSQQIPSSRGSGSGAIGGGGRAFIGGSSLAGASSFNGRSSTVTTMTGTTATATGTGTADSDPEMDSDYGEGGEAFFNAINNNGTGAMTSALGGHDEMVTPGANGYEFSMDINEPKTFPQFNGSFIFRPARAQKDEARWLKVIRESADDAILASKFDLCVQYFDGITTFEEIIYRTGLNRRELDRIVEAFKDDVSPKLSGQDE